MIADLGVHSRDKHAQALHEIDQIGEAHGENMFGQKDPGFTDENFVAAELAVDWLPENTRRHRIAEFLQTIGAPMYPYAFEAAWENWRWVSRR